MMWCVFIAMELKQRHYFISTFFSLYWNFVWLEFVQVLWMLQMSGRQYMFQICCDRFSWSYPPLLTLKIILPPHLHGPLNLDGRGFGKNISHLGLNDPGLSLCAYCPDLGLSVLTLICCKKKLISWRLSESLISEYLFDFLVFDFEFNFSLALSDAISLIDYVFILELFSLFHYVLVLSQSSLKQTSIFSFSFMNIFIIAILKYVSVTSMKPVKLLFLGNLCKDCWLLEKAFCLGCSCLYVLNKV